MDDPHPIGDDIETLLNGVLPEQIAANRVRLLAEHADGVIALRDLHRRVWEEMLGREVRGMVMDGLSPALAQAAARNNLAIRKLELDAELEEGLERMSRDLQRKMRRLIEDAEDEGIIPPSQDRVP